MTSRPGSGPRPAPGRYRLGPRVAAFDRSVDRALEPLRGRRAPDALFVNASRLGDWSLIWHLVGLTRVVAEGRRGLRRSVVFAALLGAESLIVNQGIKRIFNRQRPTIAGDERLQVRKPLTSSFPSGHASAAGFSGVVLTDQEGPSSAALWVPMGSVVALSRVYVRIHHASDVVAGVAVGAALGLLGRGVSRRLLRTAVLR
ncbi:MAG: phosphatase PAP2 family protein [Actinomycetota bacterium]|nr:phosphatase PAP2 family protein [Actinomycetota bacterium]